MNKNIAVSFTGHRPNKLGGYDEDTPLIRAIKDELSHSITNAIVAGYTEFISGMAMGIDTWAAETVLEAKKTCNEIKLICAVPFNGQECKWREDAQKRY